jgi:hypothetical protein
MAVVGKLYEDKGHAVLSRHLSIGEDDLGSAT